LVVVGGRWWSLVVVGGRWWSLVAVGCRWLLLVVVGCRWLSLSDIKGRGVFWQVSAWEMQARKAVEEVGVRVVDSAGGPSNAGLLQVQIGDGQFGTVCRMDLAAVDVVCRQLGDAYVASGGHWHLCV
jgi:hypothetical protein